MRKFLRKKPVNVCLDLTHKTVCYLLEKIGDRFRIVPKTEEETGISGSVVKFTDSLEVKKIEVPKSVSDNILKNIISQELGEDIVKNNVFKYEIFSTTDKFKILNVVYFNKSDFYEGVKDVNRESIKFFTYIPFSLNAFLKDYKDKNVLYIHMFEDMLFMVFSVKGVLDFYRYAQINSNEDIYENIVLTYRYINSSLGKVDLILLSLKNNVEILDSFGFYQILDRDIAMLNPLYYLYSEGVNPEELFDYLIPVGTLLLSEDYNFVPDDIIYSRNFQKSIKLVLILLLPLNLISFGILFFKATGLVDKYMALKEKEQRIRVETDYITQHIGKERVAMFNERNKLLIEKTAQIEALNKLKDYGQFLMEKKLKLDLTRVESEYKMEISFAKSFDSVKSMELFYDENKDKLSLSKRYQDKTVEAKLIYVVPKKSRN